jgi:hypothetical protein
MADEKPPPEFMSALVTEHFVLQSTAPPYFQADDAVAGNHGVRYGRWSFLFTMASMVIVVNCVLGGATIALLCDLGLKAPLPAATAMTGDHPGVT